LVSDVALKDSIALISGLSAALAWKVPAVDPTIGTSDDQRVVILVKSERCGASFKFSKVPPTRASNDAGY
jgi:hypothetical protein